jgi:small subunit ribosomal protein S1
MTTEHQPETEQSTSTEPEAPAAPAAAASAEPTAEAAPAAAPSTADTGDGDDDAGDAEGEEGEAGASAEGGAAADGTAKPKRKRRRRKKKKPGAEAGAEGAEGAPGQEGGKPAREPKEERERPAFNVGDVVFGKVIEFNEDVILIDLAGKAKALFDLRELLIQDDEDDNTPDEDEAEEAAEAKAEGAPEARSSEVSLAATTEGEAVASSPPEAPKAETPAPAAAEAAPAAEAPAEAEKPKDPTLPRVILEPGAPFVGVVHNDGGRGGCVVLTHHPKRVRRAKPVVSAAFRDKTLVFGIVTGVIKGGVEVDIDGLRAFAPASHMDLRHGADLSDLVGKRMAFSVAQYGKRGRDVVVSRRSMLEAEAKALREEALSKIEIGAVVDGIVRTVVQFGAFVDVGGVEGLVPLSEMSHNRGDQPKDVFKVGETVPVKILRLDEKGKLWLSRRAAVPDPWAHVAEKYKAGTKHTGKVARLQPFGVFVELESAVDGLIHLVDLSQTRIEHPNEVVKVGDEIEVVVAHVDAHNHRIALHPAPTGEAANEEPQRIAPQKIVKVVVTLVEAGGINVRIKGATGRSARAFISGAGTGTPKGADLRKLFPIGKELEAKVLEVDPQRGIKLSIKAVSEDNERNAFQAYRAQVKREAKFGTLADLLQKSLKKD